MNLLHQEREQYVSKVKQCEDSIDTFKTRSAKVTSLFFSLLGL